jgi:hypothetical protein
MKSIAIQAAAAAMLVVAGALPMQAQGKAKGAEKKAEKPKTEKVTVSTSKGDVVSTRKAVKADKPASKALKKRVTTSQAVIVTRDVLVTNGYQIVNIVPSGATQVIYYRRGNRGNGRGLGPVEKIVVVPSGEIVTFQAVPQPLLSTILRRLGL